MVKERWKIDRVEQKEQNKMEKIKVRQTKRYQ